MRRIVNQPYSTTASTSTRILQFDTGAVIGEGAPIEGRGALGEAQGIARAVSPEHRRAALRLIGSEQDRRQELFELMVSYAKSTEQWRRTLTDPEIERWEGQLQGYADAVNVLTACPFTDATTAELAAALARGCGRFSLLPSQQRRRAYLGAAKKRRKRRKELEAVLQHHAEGVSWRKIAELTGVPMRTARRWVSTANGTPLETPISTANGTPLADRNPTANGTPDRAISRLSDPEHASTTGEGAGPPPGRVAGGAVYDEHEREGEPTDKAGGCGRGQPSLGAPAPVGATSHPRLTLPTETEPASGGTTDGGPEPKGPKVGEQLANVIAHLAERRTIPRPAVVPSGSGSEGLQGLARAIREGAERARANPDRLRTPEERAQDALDRDAAVRERDRLRLAAWYMQHPEHR